MLVVQKFGGTSMGGCARIEAVAKRVIESKKLYEDLVVVVSAMGDTTDDFLNLAHYFGARSNQRELDRLLSSGEQISSALLAIALESMGQKACSLSGSEAGILTDARYTKAQILDIDTAKIKELLAQNFVVVVAGFQGISPSGEITTLGRGGSDLSAVALAGALHAGLCEIYTDVDGIYTTDPRIVPRARKIDEISYEEMLELASMGAKVLFNRSVELAKKYNIPLVTRNSFNSTEGTRITSEEKILEKPIVSGIALDTDQARVNIVDALDYPGIAGEVFGLLAGAGINIDLIVQTVARNGKTDINFTVPKGDLEACLHVLKNLQNIGSIEHDDKIAKVSVVGVGMRSHSGIASAVFNALAKENINILMIGTSEIKISVVVEVGVAELALKTLHTAFKLDL
ncbi:aspartate kinase [Helicobacter ailurogastricus]|uniref:aspartate kinase n=1 Tax=Helicobacter ailurogastricus TaxID=1578720 RepID=UPI0022C3F121|nr:aspartate kinase [Helicobacter ailurogastricus]GLH58082.1 Aspartate kinase LysC [Helicobacter ailurogastricus]GLH58907.1 Aspartate kinase LysC [Helicobacter ailurogastricus]GMB90875.1 Aspartate kinase LysC [Helicobacter ailurogastricus]